MVNVTTVPTREKTEKRNKSSEISEKTILNQLDYLQTEDPDIIKAAWEEHKLNVGDHQYEALLGDRKPPLDYRK